LFIEEDQERATFGIEGGRIDPASSEVEFTILAGSITWTRFSLVTAKTTFNDQASFGDLDSHKNFSVNRIKKEPALGEKVVGGSWP